MKWASREVGVQAKWENLQNIQMICIFCKFSHLAWTPSSPEFSIEEVLFCNTAPLLQKWERVQLSVLVVLIFCNMRSSRCLKQTVDVWIAFSCWLNCIIDCAHKFYIRSQITQSPQSTTPHTEREIKVICNLKQLYQCQQCHPTGQKRLSWILTKALLLAMLTLTSHFHLTLN